MSYAVILAVVLLFYFLTKNYNANDYAQKIHVEEKQVLQGDLGEHEAGLLVALMAKVAKADGRVNELEAELLSLTFSDIAKAFENAEAIREALKAISQ